MPPLPASQSWRSLVVGPLTFVVVHLATILFAGTIGVWLFYVQHQFQETEWDGQEEWDFRRQALEGSSFYDLPAPLRWLTANIGIHHVHHLRSRIPSYRLYECLKDIPELRKVNRLTMWESFKCVPLALWDDRQRKLVSFRTVAGDGGDAIAENEPERRRRSCVAQFSAYWLCCWRRARPAPGKIRKPTARPLPLATGPPARPCMTGCSSGAAISWFRTWRGRTRLWIDLFGMEIDTENVPDADSLSYDLFNVPNTAPTRFATLNAGPGQSRTLGIYEVPGLLPDERDRIRRGAVVINANGRLDAIRDALPGLGLSMLREKTLVTVDQQVGIETGFHDWDGNLIVLYELEGAQSP